MERRDFLAFLALSGCGGDVEYPLQPSPRLRTSKNVYEYGVEGSWTPILTFETPGNSSVTYAQQVGSFIRIGDLVFAYFIVDTTTTVGTASNAVLIQGLPYVARSGESWVGSCTWGSSLSRTGYTQLNPVIFEDTSQIRFHWSGPSVASLALRALDIGTVSVNFIGTIAYHATEKS